MIRLGDSFYLQIQIDGVEIPVELLGINPLQLSSNVTFFQPMGKLVLGDKYGYFDDKPMSDGAKVDIFIGKSPTENDARLYRFRLFRYTLELKGNVKYYTLFMTFNCPRFFNENFTGALKGPSHTVLASVASVSGVDFSGDPTTDPQTWYGAGKKRCVFAREVALHGYANAESCMTLGMTLLGELRYKNLSTIKAGATPNTFIQGASSSETKHHRVLDRKEINKGGFSNNLIGYRLDTVEQNTLSPGEDLTTHKGVKVALTSAPALSVNKILNENLEGSRVVVTPVSSGNTHHSYYRAEHQNRRLRSTYSLGNFVVTDSITGLDLLDPVNYLVYENASNELKLNQAVSGSYIIAGKTIYATKEGRYFEKFELLRQGPNFYAVENANSQILAY